MEKSKKLFIRVIAIILSVLMVFSTFGSTVEVFAAPTMKRDKLTSNSVFHHYSVNGVETFCLTYDVFKSVFLTFTAVCIAVS